MEKDTEGLQWLRWSMFDSLDQEGSGYKYMEKEPVMILDRVIQKSLDKQFNRLNPNVVRGYVSPSMAFDLGLEDDNSHRIGKAIMLRCIHPATRLKLIDGLLREGVKRIKVSDTRIYFDTDYPYKPIEFTINPYL